MWSGNTLQWGGPPNQILLRTPRSLGPPLDIAVMLVFSGLNTDSVNHHATNRCNVHFSNCHEKEWGPQILLLEQISSLWGNNVLIRTFTSVCQQKIARVKIAFPFRLCPFKALFCIIFVGGFSTDEFGPLKGKCASQCLSALRRPGDSLMKFIF